MGLHLGCRETCYHNLDPRTVNHQDLQAKALARMPLQASQNRPKCCFHLRDPDRDNNTQHTLHSRALRELLPPCRLAGQAGARIMGVEIVDKDHSHPPLTILEHRREPAVTIMMLIHRQSRKSTISCHRQDYCYFQKTLRKMTGCTILIRMIKTERNVIYLPREEWQT